MSRTPKYPSKIIAIDFDGTICQREGKNFGAPLPGAEAALLNLHKRGHKIIVHTVMARTDVGRRMVSDWMVDHDLPFAFVTALKPTADFYIDNHGIEFTNWEEVSAKLYERGAT